MVCSPAKAAECLALGGRRFASPYRDRIAFAVLTCAFASSLMK